jgi:glucose-6-phosphate 1-dehydrogenase
MVGKAVELIACDEQADVMQPYERLLGDALLGDGSLFTRDDCVEAAWRVVEPILEDTAAPAEYAPGSWGPLEAGRIVADNGGWHDPTRAEQRNAPCH